MPNVTSNNFRDEDEVDRDRETALDAHNALHEEPEFAMREIAKDIDCTGISCFNNFNPCNHPHCQRRERKNGEKICFHSMFGTMDDGMREDSNREDWSIA